MSIDSNLVGDMKMGHSLKFFKLSAISFVGYAFGFFTQILLSRYFGTSSIVDAYWVAMTLVTLFGFYVHPAREALVSGFHECLRDNRYDASRYASAAINFLLFFLLAASALLLLFPAFLSTLVVDADKQTLTSEVVRMLPFAAPLIPLVALTEIYNGILVSRGRIYFQDFGRIVGSFFVVLFLLLFSKSLGILSLILAAIVGNVTLLTFQLKESGKSGFTYHPRSKPSVDSGFVKMSGVLILSYLASQFYIIYERKVFVSMQEGALSGLQYAVSINNVITAIVIGSMCNITWPKLYELLSNANENEVVSLIVNNLKNLLTLICFILIFGYIYSETIIYVIFYGGKFDLSSLNLTTMFLKSALLSLVPLSISGVIGRLFVSKRNTNLLFSVGVASAFGGMFVLFYAQYIGSLKAASYHIVASAACGALISLYGSYRLYFSNYSRRTTSIKVFLWIIKLSVASAGLIILLRNMPIAIESDKLKLIIELMLRFTVAGTFGGVTFLMVNDLSGFRRISCAMLKKHTDT